MFFYSQNQDEFIFLPANRDPMTLVYLGLGSNIGDRSMNLTEAKKQISERIGIVKKVSPVYETEPWGFISSSFFLNQVISVETSLEPLFVLGAMNSIEISMGRSRTNKEYQDRIIDIDLLFFDDLIMNTKEIMIPHPHLHERRFVLRPLSDIAGAMIHPVHKKTIAELLVNCSDQNNIILYQYPKNDVKTAHEKL
jgi:2-amino-4-hydroxy-6-hydroxymethyldihydropteridine diphosphokinase